MPSTSSCGSFHFGTCHNCGLLCIFACEPQDPAGLPFQSNPSCVLRIAGATLLWWPVPRQTVFRHKTDVSRCAFTTTGSTPADFNQRQPVGVSRSTVSCGLIAEASRLRCPGACSRHSVARWPPIPVSESQAIRLPYRVAVYVELTRPTYRAHHAGDSWLLVIRLPPRLLRCGCYMMFHLFVVSGSGQPAGFATGIALASVLADIVELIARTL